MQQSPHTCSPHRVGQRFVPVEASSANRKQVLSVAALDKDPQSAQRGITLDLGFSCFEARAKGSGLKGWG